MNALDRNKLALDIAKRERSRITATRLFQAGKHLAIAHAALMEMNPRPHTANLEYLQTQLRVWFKMDAEQCGWDGLIVKSYLEVME
jgi:hypothetical protein